MNTVYALLWMMNSLLAGPCPTVQETRLLYKQAAGNETTCKNLIARVQSCSAPVDPVLTGYQAAATMMMARYAVNPFSKLSWFRKGRKLLDNTLSQHPHNVELRFLRFTIQTNAPGILGYKDDIPSDKAFLLRAIGQLTDTSLRATICDYLQQSKLLTEQEQQQALQSCFLGDAGCDLLCLTALAAGFPYCLNPPCLLSVLPPAIYGHRR